MFSRIIILLLTSLLTLAQCLTVSQSGEFTLGSEVENMVLRPSGSVLAVVYTFPHIFEVPVHANATPKLLYTFEDAHGVSSIAKSGIEDDVYFVVTGFFNFTSFTPVPDTYAIHRLYFDACGNAVVEDLAPLDAIQQANGMISVPGTPDVLITDCVGGFIYRFNTDTLELSTYFDDPLLKPQTVQGVTFGVNGIKLSRGDLYFSNTNKELVARLSATGNETTLMGTPQIVATNASFDDFIVNDYNGDLYFALNGNEALGFLPADSNETQPEIIYGGQNSTELLSPTAAIWAKGKEGKELIVSISGDFTQFLTGNFTGGGRLVFVDLE